MLYELPSLKHVDVESVEEAVFCLHKYEDAKVIAGGTDLLGLMKDRIEGPELKVPKVLINIKTIPEMNRITYDEEVGLRIGAAVTLNRLETSGVIKEEFDVLSQAARGVGTTQIRNIGTIGGNICQRPRCMYFRHPDFLCHKKGGAICYAVAGEHRDHHSIMKRGRCAAAHPSDMATALTALEARVVTVSPHGEKETPLQEFFSEPNSFTENVLKPEELLREVLVSPQKDTYQLFLKHRIRHSSDFSLSSVAVVAQICDEFCEDIRIVLGGVAPFPYRAVKAEEMVIGKRLKGSISQAAEASMDGAHPLPMNKYKLDLTKALVRRVLKSIIRKATN